MNKEKPNNWTTKKLVAFLGKAADAYRAGSPLIDDDTYDHIYLSELQRRDPEHPFLQQVEAESEFGTGRVKHPKPMLSTDKSYSLEETRKWVNRIHKEANKQGIDSSRIKVKVTAKVSARLEKKADPSIINRPLDQKPYWHVERARLAPDHARHLHHQVLEMSVLQNVIALHGRQSRDG